MYLIDLIFGLVAAFLIYRLRSVLGRRTGHERQRPSPFATADRATEPARAAERSDKVITLPDRRPAEPSSGAEPALGMRAALTQIKVADPGFSEKQFLQGAQIAFGMIVEAFAKGDTATLRPLLSDHLYDQFSEAIRGRLARNESMETLIEHVPEAEIVDARMDGRTAYITVRLTSQQVNTTRDEQGQVVDGDPARAVEVTDLWTFARNTRATNPNWTLVETATPG